MGQAGRYGREYERIVWSAHASAVDWRGIIPFQHINVTLAPRDAAVWHLAYIYV